MVSLYYPSSRETSVSQTVGRGRTSLEHCRYGKYGRSQRFNETSTNIEHQFEQLSIGLDRSKIFKGKKFETIQPDSHFQDQTPSSHVNKSKAFVSSTKFNPEAKTFVPKAIEWDKLPLRPCESSLSASLESESYERSVCSSIEDVTSFGSSDVVFVRPNSVHVSLENRSGILPEIKPSIWQKLGSIDKFLSQDFHMNDSRDESCELLYGAEKTQCREKKCYHCGCVGHMARKCHMRMQGFDAVCFECRGTGHKAAQCPDKLNREGYKTVKTHPMMMRKADCPMSKKKLTEIQATLSRRLIEGRRWNNWVRQQRMGWNERFFYQL